MEALIAAVLVILNVPPAVEARYCKLDADGQISYYVCPRNEYCCSKGCCLSPTFQFYQLWYYWLMVIFMLVVCSGGQWWYRYWVHGGRYLMPPPHVSVSSGASRPIHHRSPAPREAPTRVIYHPSHSQGSTIVFWKPPYPGRPMTEPPPSYATVVPPSPKPYGPIPTGPPPSYESVVGLSATHSDGYVATATSDDSDASLHAPSASGIVNGSSAPNSTPTTTVATTTTTSNSTSST